MTTDSDFPPNSVVPLNVPTFLNESPVSGLTVRPDPATFLTNHRSKLIPAGMSSIVAVIWPLTTIVPCALRCAKVILAWPLGVRPPVVSFSD
jgi:hypothetical protein